MCDKMISFYFLSKNDGNGDRPFSMGYPTKPDQIWIRLSGGGGGPFSDHFQKSRWRSSTTIMSAFARMG